MTNAHISTDFKRGERGAVFRQLWGLDAKGFELAAGLIRIVALGRHGHLTPETGALRLELLGGIERLDGEDLKLVAQLVRIFLSRLEGRPS